ncbi:MAG: lipoprotein release ABC transporter permease [bacterium]|nr:MAG: lipoprotein release ABC transporter permease [bacterium]KAF0148337.1 MAG: lipoprotein release ABC transporter permease [bacterium]KAF0167798.1 MAG: lipoprotein release ABC transporter permease [bacterium]TXT16242.1 MAG: lipoprotein release ABC transporter permease [bacterium]
MNTWIERQRGLLDTTVANLRRRKARNLGLFMAYVLLVFLLASVVLFGDGMRREARLLLEVAPELVVQRLTAGRHDLMPAQWLERIAGLRGVAAVEGRLWGYHHDAAVGANLTLQVPKEAAPAAGRVHLGATLARLRGLAPGDVLSLRDHAGQPHAFVVEALLDSRSELVSADLVLLCEADFRAFFGIGAGLYTDAALRVVNPLETRTVAEKVLARLPATRVISREEMRRTYDAVFNWRQGLPLMVLSVLLAAFALLAWDKASGLSAEERREIGILKALGWDSGDVLAMKLWEGALLSVLAFLLGYTLAWLHVYYAGAPLFEPVLKGWSVLYPRFALAPEVDISRIVSLALLTVLPYVAATLVPVWRAATLDPDEVMRE